MFHGSLCTFTIGLVIIDNPLHANSPQTLEFGEQLYNRVKVINN